MYTIQQHFIRYIRLRSLRTLSGVLMKKLLLIILLTLSTQSLVLSSERDYITIEYIGRGIYSFCFNNYLFLKDKRGGITQVFERGVSPQPMKCR